MEGTSEPDRYRNLFSSQTQSLAGNEKRMLSFLLQRDAIYFRSGISIRSVL